MELFTNNWDLLKNIDMKVGNAVAYSPPTPRADSPADNVNSFYYVSQGEFMLSVNEKHYVVSEGQLALLPKGKKYACKLLFLMPLTVCRIEFTSTIQGVDIFEKFGLNDDNHVISIARPTEFWSLCTGLCGKASGAARLVSRAADVMSIIAMYINERVNTDALDNKAIFHPVISYMQNNLNKHVSNSFLSELIFMEPNYFIRKFKKTFSRTPMKYYNELRFKTAAELLAETDMPIQDVGAAIGMQDSSHFSHFFKKLCGVYPTEYRCLSKALRGVENPQTIRTGDAGEQNVDIVPGNIYFQNPHIFWVEDFVFTNDMIYFVAEGEFALWVDGKRYIVKPNQAALLPKGKRVIYSLTSLQRLSFYRIDFEIMTNGVNLLEYLRFTGDNHVVDIADYEQFISICKNAIHDPSLAQDIPYHVNRISAMLKLASMYIRGREEMKFPENVPEFAPAVEYMKSNLGGSVTISLLSELMSMDATYFIRKFKKTFAVSPMKYYDILRAGKAASLLADTSIPINKIGALIGLKDAAYFKQFFKRFNTVTPNEYRRLFTAFGIKE